MKQVYKTKWYKIILNIGLGFFVAIVVTGIASLLIKSPLLQILVFIAALAVYMWLVILDNIITIEVDDSVLCVKKGKKTSVYPLNTSSFRAVITVRKQKNSVINTNTEYILYAMPENGNEEMINCELIGSAQFEHLMENLGITGDSAPVHKIDTKKTL